MRLIKKLRYCLMATVPVVALAACSSGGSSSGVATGPAPEQSSIVIDAVPTADAAGLYIAEDDGYFAQQGLNVKIVPINGGEYGMGDLQTGKAQLIEGNYVSFILAQIAGKFAAPNPNNPAQTEPSKPIDMRLIANSSQMQAGNQALYVMPNSPYKTVADLAKDHASVAINSQNNIAQVLLGSLFVADGLKVGTLKQVVQPAFPLTPGMLAKHDFDAAWLPEPFGTEAEQDYGAVQLADFDQGSLENFPIGTVAGNQSWIASHPNTVAAFLRAYDEGQQVADTNRAAVEAALVTHTGVTKELAATMTLDTYPLVMDVPVMQRVADAMYEFGVIGKTYNITQMIQPEPGEITK
jgi:NitT/TauT family transport system substrate-binding protein